MSPERFSWADRRLVALCAFVIAAGTAIGVSFFSRAFPEASIDFRVTREEAREIAARELSRGIKLVLASNPTRGLDVAAAAAVQRRLVAAAREAGAAVLLISSDLDEVLALSDRVGVLYGGTLTLLGSRGVSRDAVGAAMVGA